MLRPPGMRAIAHHLGFTGTEVWAFFRLAGVNWQGLSTADQTKAMDAFAHRLADQSGRRVWLRVMANPWPVAAYGRSLIEEYPDAIPDRGDGARSWDGPEGLVESAQRYLVAIGARVPLTVLGVRISTRAVPEKHWESLFSGDPVRGTPGWVEKVRQTLRDVEAAVARPGMAGEPLTQSGLDWVMRSSMALGFPAPEAFPDRLQAFSPQWTFPETVRVVPRKLGLSTRLEAVTDSGDAMAVRHVVVLRHRHAEARDTGSMYPWLAWLAAQPETVDVSALFDVIPPERLKPSATRDHKVQQSITHANIDTGLEDRGQVRAIDHAGDILDELDSPDPTVSHRMAGQILYAVTAEREQDALDIARELVPRARRDAKLHMVHEIGQTADYHRFRPGEAWELDLPVKRRGHVTRMNCQALASAMPAVSHRAGDTTGFLVGPVRGSHDALILDPFGGARQNTSNVRVDVGSQGSGKTTRLIALADFMASGGVQGVFSDFTGFVARTGRMRHLKQDFHVVDAMKGKSGSLMPSLLVLPPNPADYRHDTPVDPGGDEWAAWAAETYPDAVRRVDAERADLTIDALYKCLNYAVVKADPLVVPMLEECVGEVGAQYGQATWEYVDWLDRQPGDGYKNLARQLKSRAKLPDGRLIFPDSATDGIDEAAERRAADALFTLVMAPGIVMPPKGNPDRSTWSREQLRSDPIIFLTGRYAQRLIWRDTARKFYFGDEMSIGTGGESSMSSLIQRFCYDSRKNNAAIHLAFQTVGSLQSIDAHVASLIGSFTVGRTGTDNAEAALPFLRLPTGQGWEQHIAGLADGEAMWRTWDNKVRTVQTAREWWHEDLVSVTESTPMSRAADLPSPVGVFR